MLLSENPKMKRIPHESREAKIGDYKARVTRVTLSTPDLGSWDVFEWELFENNSLVGQGSCPFGDSFISHQDVLTIWNSNSLKSRRWRSFSVPTAMPTPVYESHTSTKPNH
jgi:hypothetical protein